jgi:drug/metabolite transporter (DMT)-like permease
MAPTASTRLNPTLVFLMTLPPLLWAGNAVVGRLAADLISPLLLNLLRWLGAGLLLAPLGWRLFADAESRERIRRHGWYLAWLGLLGVGAFNALQYTGLRTTTPLNATLILASGPVWSLAIGALVYGVSVRRIDVLGAALSLAGVLLVISGGSLERLARLQLAPGDLLLLVATIGWSFYTWMLARPPQTLRPAGAREWTWAEFLLLQIVIGFGWAAAATAVQWVALPGTFQPTTWSPLLLGLLAYVVIGPSLLAYRCWGLGVSRAGPTLAAFFANLAPLFAALMSLAVLGDVPRWFHAAAFALIVAGIVVSTRAPRRGGT